MSIKAILFDLDGTLLPMDQEIFTKTYFGLLSQELAAVGYESKKLINSVLSGIEAMVENSGEKTNEQVFWDKFVEIYGENSRQDMSFFEKFYREHFDKVKVSSGYNPKAKQIVEKVKQKGIKVVLATNPLFPRIATEKRIDWAGLSPEDFVIFTTYENSRHCKPNLEYYKDIMNELEVDPKECLMVGNDVSEDMVAKQLGIEVFLLTDNLINKKNIDISQFPNGSFDVLFDYIERI